MEPHLENSKPYLKMINPLNRRSFILKSGLAALGTTMGVSSCQKKTTDAGGHNLAKAKLAADLVIKETVGLRPYRLSGPGLESVKLGGKTIVHYGHGGSGFSLSWGTAKIAVDLVTEIGQIDAAVIGSGVIGLTTARVLQNRGYKVRIYAKDIFPDHASSLATGTWSPANLLCENNYITDQFKDFWKTSCLHAFKSHQNLLGINNGIVEWISHYIVNGKTHHEEPSLHIKDLLPNRVTLDRHQHPFKGNRVMFESTMVFNIPSYLQYLMDEFRSFGGEIVM